MFEKTQKSANPSILTADPVIEAKSKAGSITPTQASGEPEATFELPDVHSDLKGGIFAKGLLQLLEEHRPTRVLHQTQLVDAMLLENVTQCLGGP